MSKPLKENCILRLKCTDEPFDHGEANAANTDHIELMTRGNFVKRGENFYLSYQETEMIGYAGCTVTIKMAADGSRVALLRYGRATTQLLIERGRRNLCHYETELGSMTMGVTGDGIECGLTEQTGGTAKLCYLLDNEDIRVMSRNTIEITVTLLDPDAANA